MNTVTLPRGTVYIRFATATHLLATAICPKAAPQDGANGYSDIYANVDRTLSRAVELGDLQAREPLTHLRHPYPVGKALREADILVEDLRQYAVEQGLPSIELSADTISQS